MILSVNNQKVLTEYLFTFRYLMLIFIILLKQTEKNIFQSNFSYDYQNQFWDQLDHDQKQKEVQISQISQKLQIIQNQSEGEDFECEQINEFIQKKYVNWLLKFEIGVLQLEQNIKKEKKEVENVQKYLQNNSKIKVNLNYQYLILLKVPFMNTNKNNIKNHEQKDNLDIFKRQLQMKPRKLHKVGSFILDRNKSEKSSPIKLRRRSSETFISFKESDFQKMSSLLQLKKVNRNLQYEFEEPDRLIQEEQTNIKSLDVSDDFDKIQLQNINGIHWEFNCEKQEPVKLSFQITIQNASNSCLKFCLWISTQHNLVNEKKEFSDEDSTDSQEQEKINQGNQVTYFEESQIAECCIPYSKLLAEEPILFTKDGIQMEERIIEFQEKLLCQGQEFGVVEFEVQSHQIPYIKQILVGVMTEKGIQKSSTSVYYRDSKVDSEIKQLEQAKQQLIENMFRLQANDKEIVGFERLKLKEEMLNHFNKVYQLSQMTHKVKIIYLKQQIHQLKSLYMRIFPKYKNFNNKKLQLDNDFFFKIQKSVLSFYYKSQSDLTRAQLILMELADYLLTYADEVDEYLRESYYKCLKMIVNRGEFNLDNMGFYQSYQQIIKGKAANFTFTQNTKQEISDIKFKLQAGLQYQNFQYKILDKVLTKMQSQYPNGEEKSFIENFCAIAFFRIPLFQNDEDIPEDLKSIFAYFDHKVSILEGNKIYESLVDWQQFFEQYMLSDMKGEINYESLKSIIQKNTKYWQRIGKKNRGFFYFLTEWALYVNNTVIKKDQIPWNELPGYQILMKSFLLQMQKKETKNYTDSMKIASVNLLLNPGLLKIYIHIAYRKTKVLDHQNVLSTFKLIDLWMQTLTSNQSNIPADFDFKSFFKGIQLVLEGDHAMCISKGLKIIYNNYTLLSNDTKQEICEYLFGNIFFKLFMHWSFNVRYIFHHLLVYRIEHLSKRIQSNSSLSVIREGYQSSIKSLPDTQYNFEMKENALNRKYIKMMKVIENAKYNYQHFYADKVSNTSKGILQMSLVQRLKDKLADRKMKNNIDKQQKQQKTSEDELSRNNRKRQHYATNNIFSLEYGDQEYTMQQSASPRNNQQTEQNGMNSFFDVNGKEQDLHFNSKSILTSQSKQQSSPPISGCTNTLTTPRNEKKKKNQSNKSVQFNSKQIGSLSIIEQSFFTSEMEDNNLITVPDQSFESENSKCDNMNSEYDQKFFETQESQTKIKGDDQPNYFITQIKRSQTDELGKNQLPKDNIVKETREYSPSNAKKTNTQTSIPNIKRDQVKRISFISPNKKQKALVSGDKFLYIETLDKGHSLKKIEKQYIRYLPKAFEEFLKIKEEYSEWISAHYEKIQSIQGNDKVTKYLKEIEVPQVQMKSSIDGLEGLFIFEQ